VLNKIFSWLLNLFRGFFAILNKGSKLTPKIALSEQINPLKETKSPTLLYTPTTNLESFTPIQQEWEIFLATHISQETRRAYQSDFQAFLVFWKNLDANFQWVEQINLEHLVRYRNHLENTSINGKKLSKASLNRKIATLKSFVRHCQERELLEMPIKLLKSFPQSTYSATQAFSDSQVCAILEGINTKNRTGSLHYAVLLTLFHLGLRRSECAALTFGNISEEKGIRSIQIQGKGNRVRRLPIPENVWLALLYYWRKNPRELSNESPVFCAVKKGYQHKDPQQQLSTSQIYAIVKKYQAKAIIKGKFSPHSARATAISNAIDHNAHVSQIQYFAGWSTPTMMTRYDKRRALLENSAVFKIDFQRQEHKNDDDFTQKEDPHQTGQQLKP